MAFTLQIKGNGLFKKKLDFEKMVKKCGMMYGTADEFFVLREGQIVHNQVIIYNRKRIGRGIYLDMTQAYQCIYEMSYNIPSTKTEIMDFVSLTKEIVRQMGKVTMYCVEEECSYTLGELEAQIDQRVAFSLAKLNEFCSNKEYSNYIFTLAMWPFYVPKEKVQLWEHCYNLEDFEDTLHRHQDMDVYYAKPSLYKNNETGRIVAYYTLTSNCDSIFPLRIDGFLNMNNIKVDEGLVQFFIYEEKRALDGFVPYERFIEAMKERGARSFDETHIQIAGVSKEEMESFARGLAEVMIKLEK